jgi:hypothetical protein
VALVAACDLNLDDGVPELFVSPQRRVEHPDDDVVVLARMRLDRLGSSDEADALLEVVTTHNELLASGAEGEVRTVPRERAMPNARLVAELGREERLQTHGVAGDRRLGEEQEVAPVVRGISRRANEDVVVPLLDHPFERQDIEVGRVDERSHGRLLALACSVHRARVRAGCTTRPIARLGG